MFLFTHHPLPDASMRVCVTTCWPRSSGKPSFHPALSTHLPLPLVPSQKLSKTKFNIQLLTLAQHRGWPGLEHRLLAGNHAKSLKLALLKKCHLVNRCPKPPGEHLGHSLRVFITRNLKELKAIMTDNKDFLLRRMFRSLKLLVKPSYTFRSSGTAVEAHYCWLKNYMGRRLWFASAFALSGTRSMRVRRINPQGRFGEKEPLSAICSPYKLLPF